MNQVGEAPGHVELGAIVRVEEVVVAVEELLRLLGSPEQPGQAAPVCVHDEMLVRLPLAAVEVLADDLGGVREGLPRRMRLGDQRGALGDVLDHHDARIRPDVTPTVTIAGKRSPFLRQRTTSYSP